jgi:Arylsulfotransferase (ASST)
VGIKATAQPPTIGLLYSNENATDGYTLFTPELNDTVYLINNCGQVVNSWTFSETPSLSCYLREDGTLLRAGADSIEIRDWDNNLIWSYAMTANNYLQHHDIEPLPNGNILCIVTDQYTYAEISALGRDPSLGSTNLKLDKIIEINPTGTNGANIVWEWRFIDHIIQNYDNAKPNFGVVYDHPELIDFNYDNGFSFDWVHLNAIDYNADLDQILLSSRHLSELYIVDHSTTIAEAASHLGGNSNLGGDFLWRWGNNQTYDHGTALDQKMFLQHDAQWVPSGYVDEGKITVFNNRGDGTNTFSSLHLIEPAISGGLYSVDATNAFLPIQYDWTWSGSILGHLMYEEKKSGLQALPNGNILLCETYLGQVSEIMKDGTLLWSYRNPSGSLMYNQYDPIDNLNVMYRAEKYLPGHPGLIGEDLTPQGIIEDQNILSDSCITLGIDNHSIDDITIINPVIDNVIHFNEVVSMKSIQVIDLKGNVLYQTLNFSGNEIAIDLPSGLYLLQLINSKGMQTKKILVH